MSIQYMEIHGQKLPIEDGELRERVEVMQGEIADLNRYTGLAKSKNLLINICENRTFNGGGTVTVNKDKSITINGSFTDSNTTVFLDNQSNNLELGKQYIASISKVDVGISFNVTFYTSGSTTEDCGSTNTSINFTTPNAIYLNRLFLSIPSGTYNVTVYPMISVEGGEYEPYVEDLQTQLDNSKINSNESLINTNLSASENAQTITINNYNNYNGLYIVIRPSGDMSNGEHIFVPKCLFGLSIPFTVNSNHNFDDVYTCRTHGYVKDGVINFNKLKCKGWTFMQVLVIGLK